MGESGDKSNLVDYQDLILALAKDINTLYKSMDDSLRFQVEKF